MTQRALAVLTASFFTIFIAYAIRYGYGLLLPEMLPSLGITKAQAGIVYAAYFVAYTVCSPILGLISDRYNMKILLTLFTGVLGCGAVLMAWADSVAKAALFFSLAGVGNAACWTPVMALVQRWVPEQRRGTALGVASLGGGVGLTLWSFLLPVIVGRYDWKAGWVSMGLFSFIVAVVNYVAIQSWPQTSEPNPMPRLPSIGLRAVLQTYWQLLKVRELWLIGLAYLLVGFATLVPYSFLGTYATEMLSLSFASATRFIAVISVAGMAGKLVLATWSDSLGRIKVMMICSGLMAAGCLGMAWGGSVGIVHVSCVFFGLGVGTVWPVYAAAAPDFFPKAVAGGVIGLWTVFLGLGSIFSPVVCGWTIDRSGAYHWAFVLGAVCAVGSALFLIPLGAGKRRPTV